MYDNVFEHLAQRLLRQDKKKKALTIKILKL